MIEKSKLIEEVPMGREISDMYLKHPGNESSSDEEGTEQTAEIGMSLAISKAFSNGLLLAFI